MREVILDFETSYNSHKDSANIWLWTYATVDSTPQTKWGVTIESLLYLMSKENKPPFRSTTFYFHNLSFDGVFILSKLLELGYTHTFDDIGYKEFKCSFMNNTMYSIEFKFDGGKILIRDSLKIIPLPVEEIPNTFGFNEEITKGTIDYEMQRDIGYVPTKNEIEYGLGDTIIVAKGMYRIRKEGLNRCTTAGNAISHCKKIIKDFDTYFPILSNEFISEYYEAYMGGLSFCNPKYCNKIVHNGLVLDVNSEYPWAMEYCPLPYGNPVPYKTDCFFIKIKVKLREKENCPNFLFISATRQLMFRSGEVLDLILTSVDYNNMHKYYIVDEEIVTDIVYFESKIGIIKPYIEYWKQVKVNAELEGNKGMRYIAKLMLNSLYGKFGAKWYNEMSRFELDENGILKNVEDEYFDNDTIYMPFAAFVTAWGRDKLLKAIYELMNQENDNFLYCDTDSVHMLGRKIPDSVILHQTDFGSWKAEFEVLDGIYIHSKCYMEIGYELKDNLQHKNEKIESLVKCCGLPSTYNETIDGITYRRKTRDLITLDMFHKGAVFHDIKLKKKNCKGGCYLERGDFTIK